MTVIAAGTRLGPYEVVSRVGAGGMGEVWKARDTRLDRSVAIKILPVELAQNAQFKLRFEREAKTISQFNHPHICTLYDVGDDYLVMELLQGETLADRLQRGALPLPDVLKYGAQIADALDRAHRSGVVHRDLKPGNVMITPTGAKLLDFGLAKSGGLEVFDGATVQKPLTQEGTILGTFQYMAPEQLEGQEADARTDIFALGAVLYEMMTGQRAFDGKTKTSLIAAIVSSTPRPLSEMQPLAPPALDHVLAKCLEKDREQRWQSAHDVAEELRWIGGGTAQAAAIHVPRSRKRAVANLFVVIAAVAIGAGAMWGFARMRASSPQTTRTSILIPNETPLSLYGANRVSVSPDGKLIAYVAERGGTPQIYLRRLDRLDATPLQGAEGGTAPFFSPDSQSIGFFDGKHLRRISIANGAPQTIADSVDVRWATWTSDGTIVFERGTEGLFAVSADGGTPSAVIRSGAMFPTDPEAIPGSSAVLAVEGTGKIISVDLHTKEIKTIYASSDPPVTAAMVAPPGYLLFIRGQTLFAAPFDTKRVEITGAAKTVADNIVTTAPFTTPFFSASHDGTLIYVASTTVVSTSTLVWVDRTGKETPVSAIARAFEEPRLSPDGTRIAVTLRESNPDIWIEDTARAVLTRFTFGAQEDETPVWSADGKSLAYSALRNTTHGIYLKSSDGAGAERQFVMTKNHAHAGSFSPDGSSFVFTDYAASSGGDIWILPLNGTAAPRPLVQSPFNERGPRISPDGHWLAYTSDESGRDEVYVQSFPTPGAKFQVSTDGGTEPVWSPRGDELFYRHVNAMMSVGVALTPTFSARNPELLFEGQFAPMRRGEAAYDVAADGKKFLMVKRTAGSSPPQIVVVTNFMNDLKRESSQ